MKITLSPYAAPAQQLLAMRWAEQNKRQASGKIFTSTRVLIRRGYVQVDSGGLDVWLTDAGRLYADGHQGNLLSDLPEDVSKMLSNPVMP